MPRTPEPDPIAEFVEEVGDLFDQMGQQRIAGRVVGWLLVCDPPHQSAPEIGEAVRASKASVSTVLRNLLASGLVERLGLPGDRRTYYRVRSGAWTEVFVAKMRFTDAFLRTAERGLEAVGSQAARRDRLEEMVEFYRFSSAEMASLLERWQQHLRTR